MFCSLEIVVYSEDLAWLVLTGVKLEFFFFLGGGVHINLALYLVLLLDWTWHLCYPLF